MVTPNQISVTVHRCNWDPYSAFSQADGKESRVSGTKRQAGDKGDSSGFTDLVQSGITRILPTVRFVAARL